MNPIKTLEKLTPAFYKAGEIALSMQKSVKKSKKFHTGYEIVDLVTNADLEVQEFLLKELAKTELSGCRILAEEKTPSTKLFKNKNKFYLAIDPIDGTYIYKNGGKFFNVIVSLHNGKDILYTFKHFPALNWTHKIIRKKYQVFGRMPTFHGLPKHLKKCITFNFGNPKKTIPELYKKINSQGLTFRHVNDVIRDYGQTEMFICKKIAGRYLEDINVYDGLVTFHYAQAKGLKYYASGPSGKFDLTNIKSRKIGLYYPGYFLVINQ